MAVDLMVECNCRLHGKYMAVRGLDVEKPCPECLKEQGLVRNEL